MLEKYSLEKYSLKRYSLEKYSLENTVWKIQFGKMMLKTNYFHVLTLIPGRDG